MSRKHNRGLNYDCRLFDRNSESWSKVGSEAFWSHWGLGFRHQVFLLLHYSPGGIPPVMSVLIIATEMILKAASIYILVEERVKLGRVGRSQSAFFLHIIHSFLSLLPHLQAPPHLTPSLFHTYSPSLDDFSLIYHCTRNWVTCLPLDQSLGNETVFGSIKIHGLELGPLTIHKIKL